MYRDFTTVMKQMTASSVHSPKPLTDEEEGKVAKRQLHDNGHPGTSKSPFAYDPNVLGTFRPDQVPRLLGAITDPEALPKKTVKLDDLHAMQDRVSTDKVESMAAEPPKGKPPVVVRHQGRDYIADGHHRLAADWLNGAKEAEVGYKDLESPDQALKALAPDIRFEKLADPSPKLAKVADELGVVFGWAIICTKDGQPYYDLNVDQSGPHAGKRVPENIPPDSMLKSSLPFALSARSGNEMHAGPDTGIFPYVFPMTNDIAKAYGITTRIEGLMVGYKPEPDVLAKFKSGEYTGFSIEGNRLSYFEHAA